MFIRQHKHHDSPRQGQVLLITVMLLAAAVTVVMTIAFNSSTETQITKMEEDSQKALSAAETALEAAIQDKTKTTVALSDIPAFAGSGITGEATVIEAGTNEFVTPLLQRDEQYTFYLASYNAGAFSNYWTGSLSMYLWSETTPSCSPATNAPALELTFINSDNSTSRALIDPCGIIQGDATNRIAPNLIASTILGTNFAYRTSAADPILGSIANRKVVIVRVLNASTRIGFTGTSMRMQGRTIISEAKTQTGVVKKIQLFQSYPQIPSDFFVTSF